MDKKARLVILISGNGSNLQAILDACEVGRLPARVLAVFSDRGQAYGLQRAEQRQIPTIIIPPTPNRAFYDADLAGQVAVFEPDWVVLAGWMRLLTMNFLSHFPNRVINLHPALPGQFPGVNAIERAFEAYRRGEISQTGVMVHLVPDEGVDDGPLLASQTVLILPDDTLETLTARVHQVEHELLVETLRGVVTGQIKPESL
jgi:formyltetrahydrofolate-dependent phosphoribosylglycinamide formyltransferase